MKPSVDRLIAYLDSVAELYPAGIGSALDLVPPGSGRQENSRLVSWGDRAAPILIAAVAQNWTLDPQGRPFAGECGKLLLGIVEKGMGRTASDVFVGGLQSGSGPEGTGQLGRLRRLIRVDAGQTLLVLGSLAAQGLGMDTLDFSERRGKAFKFGDGQAVLLYGLDEIRENRRLKKEFWEDLKGLANRSC